MAVERFYGELGQPAYVRIPSVLDASVDRGLAAAGWTDEGESLTLIGDLGAASGEAALSPSPTSEWLAASDAIAGRGPNQAAVLAAVLARIRVPCAFAEVRREGTVVALAYGALCDGWLCLEHVATHGDWRRRGLAGQVVGALMAWGRGQGGHGVGLQTQAENMAAQALYRRLGIGRELNRYRYRKKA